METKTLKKNALFNPEGDTDLALRRMIGGNTTNLNDFNNMRYKWVSDWYRQAMNNFWIPEEINLTQDTKDYPLLTRAERTAYDKILSFLVFLDSLQSNNLPTVSEYVTANEVTSACTSRLSRSVSTARVTAICSIRYAALKSATTFCISGRRTGICCAATSLSAIVTTISSGTRPVPR